MRQPHILHAAAFFPNISAKCISHIFSYKLAFSMALTFFGWH